MKKFKRFIQWFYTGDSFWQPCVKIFIGHFILALCIGLALALIFSSKAAYFALYVWIMLYGFVGIVSVLLMFWQEFVAKAKNPVPFSAPGATLFAAVAILGIVLGRWLLLNIIG